MQYQDFTITISAVQMDGAYTITALGEEIGRVVAVQKSPDPTLTDQLAAVRAGMAASVVEFTLQMAGEELFRWLTTGGVEGHLRLAWDRARRSHQGLRIRLSIDAPEVADWPWELLHDPERDHTFALSPDTLLVRFLDQANRFGSLAQQETELPLNLLQVLPTSPQLDLAQERRNLERVAAAMPDVLQVRVLEGIVTRADLADALLMGDYDIVHFSGHGAFLAGRGYAGLNKPDGSLDLVHSGAIARLAVNYRGIKLVVLNTCSSGQVDDGRAFQGLAPQMVKFGVPAVVAMQFPITDEAATSFGREFYKRLCLGEDAGQVDVATAYARGMLAVLHPDERSWAAPVVYTHAPDGVIYRLPKNQSAWQALDPVVQRARQAALQASLQTSRAQIEDWRLVDPSTLFSWRQTLRRAEEAYRSHVSDPDTEVQQLAQVGLALTQERLAHLENALAEVMTQTA